MWADFVRAVRLQQSNYSLASQEAVAVRAGIHPRRWSRIEAGSLPSVDEALLICSLVGVTVEEAAHLSELTTIKIAVEKQWCHLSWWVVPYDWKADWDGFTQWPMRVW